jgi:sugar O-acyltransferase (sialic acid O-acetyltransferase NeuD family)
MPRPVLIIGSGGHGRVIIDALLAVGTHDIVGILDDDVRKIGSTVFGFPIVATTHELETVARDLHAEDVAIALGDNYLREHKFRQVRQIGLTPLTLVHPTAYISRFTKLGAGVIVCAKAVLNPGTVVEDNVCINTSASVDHDNHLCYSCHVYPNATLTGTVCVQEFSYIGSGAVIIPGIIVGRYAYVGAGAVVINDVGEGLTVAGTPAHNIGVQKRRPGYSDGPMMTGLDTAGIPLPSAND